jgi:transcription elongation GreA/GreB family factor
VHEFTIVGEDEADVATGKVSWLSPLAKALIGARVGDTVKWRRPVGDTDLEILDIHYPGA